MRQFTGTRSVPSRPVSGFAAERSPVDVLRADFQKWQTRWRRELTFGWLRLSLFLSQGQWLKRASQATIGGFDRTGRAIETLSWRAATSVITVARTTDWQKLALTASEPFVLPPEGRAVLVRIFAYLGGIAVLSLFAAELFKQPEVVVIREPAPRPAWIEVDKPWPAFEMSVPGVANDMHYAIQRHAERGGRKDTMSFGALGKTERFASVEIYRAGHEIATFGKTDDEITLRASEYGRVTDMEETMPIPSKFGSFQVFEFAIQPFNSYRCIGFANAFDDQRVQITGVACNMNTIVDRSTISCALDRLSLLSAASDPEITRLFAHAELRRDFCGQRDALAYATPKRASSDIITSSAKPKLRGRLER
ncbi:hypothetical protein [Pseudorhodoplanes sinuspersici]|uniref:Uncharacterized protein n=1 Tax=Pseudorhodoplanes sinuspersici TaxID=1235591 RepID=A0A1W6ZNK6_9HYPH|nr:hypothetical protein [Pseudorhodoplanes sinuspersici]ARP98983.1 hypothetical protein CAK95_07735 [Pseudorhodoplanes sinuspersici]RKE69381.1 hypothetical protein DFP91_3811 [Pseudorhodoplanes sinuspersici]